MLLQYSYLSLMAEEPSLSPSCAELGIASLVFFWNGKCQHHLMDPSKSIHELQDGQRDNDMAQPWLIATKKHVLGE
jgi:hypothetical protein